jgi:hypothetical protein
MNWIFKIRCKILPLGANESWANFSSICILSDVLPSLPLYMYVLVLFSLALEKYEGHCSQPTIIKILFVKDKRRVIRLQPYL